MNLADQINAELWPKLRAIFPSLPQEVRAFTLTMGPNQLPMLSVEYLHGAPPTRRLTVADIMPAGYGPYDLQQLLEANNALVKEQVLTEIRDQIKRGKL